MKLMVNSKFLKMTLKNYKEIWMKLKISKKKIKTRLSH